MELNILTFNISWGAMTENTGDKTAKAIAQKCIDISKEKGKGQCMRNVAKILADGINSTPYDIIALQEASKNGEIFKILNNKYSFYAMKNHIVGKSEIATIYNTNKLTLLNSFCLNIGGGNRPALIILFKDSNEDEFIHCNVHGSHTNHIDFYNKILGEEISKRFMKNINWNNFIGIIISGDLNDHGRNYWKGKISITLKNSPYLVKTDAEPPLTCCAGFFMIRGNLFNIAQDSQYGDYTIASENFTFKIKNTIPNYEINANIFPTSDHLACYCQLFYDLKQPQPTPRPRPRPQPTPQLISKKQKFTKTYSLKPNTVLLLIGLIPFLIYNESDNESDQNMKYCIYILTLIISKYISPEESIITTVSRFINELIGLNNNTQVGGNFSPYSIVEKIINRIVKNLTEWYNSDNHSIENLKSIIKFNENENISNTVQNKIIHIPIQNNITLKSKYYENLKKVYQSLNVSLDHASLEKIVNLIVQAEELKESVDKEFEKIIEYTNILSGLKSNKINDICDLNGSKIVTNQVISDCIHDYKYLIRKQNKVNNNINYILGKYFM